ncbi:MAG TPA: hypothetical protein VFS20_15905 [Longimicrobium sp.]|nr:hypothetical protein [Longimicrobium sp.]
MLFSRLSARLAAALASLALACGRDVPPRGGHDLPVVENAAPAWKEGQGWRIAEEPSVVIGEAEGAQAYQFDGVAGALRLADGTIVVGDRGSGQLRYFTARGQHLRSVGRKGDGPGEFRFIDWIGERADSVFVWDLFARRLTVLAPDGGIARVLRVEQEADGEFLQGVGMTENGTLVLRAIRPRGRREPGEHVDSVAYLRVSTADGEIAGTLGPYLLGDRVTVRSNGLSLTGEVIFGRRGVLVTGPRGFFTGSTDAFELTAHAEDGRPLHVVRRPHRPTRATGGDVRRAMEQRRAEGDLGKTLPGMGQVQQAANRALPHRSTLPAFRRALVDGDGNVWMEEFRSDEQAESTWSVLDAGGRWLGNVTAPAGLEVLQISGGTVLGRTRDELGVERVVAHPLLR